MGAYIYDVHMAGEEEGQKFRLKLRIVDDGRWGEGGGRRVKYGRPHQILIFVEEKYEFVFSQLCIWGLLALDHHFCKIYRHISSLKARYYK